MAKAKAQLEREIKAVASGGGDRNVSGAREISERRIAVLIANGEDVRNTPAWRDAMHERQTIERRSATGDGGVSGAREISDRRIAALTALGEDVRNTPAWRDAMHERQTIERRSATGDGGVSGAREISDRRIAALTALGEDVRNTPAWRDAMHERQTIERASGARSAKPAVGRSGRSGSAKVTAKNLTDLQIHQVWSTTTDPEIADSCRSALGIGSSTWMVRQAARVAVAAEYNARKAAGLPLRTTHVASGR